VRFGFTRIVYQAVDIARTGNHESSFGLAMETMDVFGPGCPD